MSKPLQRSEVLWLDTGDRDRGVGIVPLQAAALGYPTMPLAEAVSWLPTAAEARSVRVVVVVMTADLYRIRLALDELLAAIPKADRWFRLLLNMPDRGLPKSVQAFHSEVNPDSFDAIAHAAPAQRDAARALFPFHRHVAAATPIVSLPSAPVLPDDARFQTPPRLMMSGGIAAGKDFAPFYHEASRLRREQFALVHTGVAFTVSKAGKVGGGFTELGCLCEDLKEKQLRAGVALGDYATFDAAAPGTLTVFGPYANRNENTARMAASRLFLFTPLSEPTPPPTSISRRGARALALPPTRRRQLSRYSSAVDYVLFEALSTGTLVLLSEGYYSRILRPLERIASEQLGSEQVWPVPRFSTVASAYSTARQLLALSPADYAQLSQRQAAYFEQLKAAENFSLHRMLESLTSEDS